MNKLAFCRVQTSPLRESNKDSSEMVSQLLFGELVHVELIQTPWAKVTTFLDNYPGYCDSKHLFMLTDKEAKKWQEQCELQTDKTLEINTPWGIQTTVRGSFIDREHIFSIGSASFERLSTLSNQLFKTPTAFAEDYLNAPYLWGGKSCFGIDCSGLTQQVFRAFDFNLPRDASQQIDCGMAVDFEDRLAGDIAFFHNEAGKIIHVGILKNEHQIIHASGMVRIDPFNELGIINSESGELSHTLNSIKRL